MSPLKLSGKIQLPLWSIDTATMASRGSPLVLKGDMPSHGRNVKAKSISTIMVECRRKRSEIFIFI